MESVSEHYESMMQSIRENVPNANLELIQEAYLYASDKHGQ